MLKSCLVLGSLFCATYAHSFSLSVGTTLNKSINDSSKDYEGVFGVSMSQPIGLGFGWWSWSGIGQVMKYDESKPYWYSHAQGIDWNLSIVKFGIKGGMTMNDNEDIKGIVSFKMQIKLK